MKKTAAGKTSTNTDNLISNSFLNSDTIESLNLSDIKSVPNLLTILRIVLLPFLILSLIDYHNTAQPLKPVLIGSIMLLTDLLDGLAAKKLNQHTTLGSILDPISDKLIIISLGITLYYLGYMSIHVIWILLVRDLLIVIFGVRTMKRFGSILKTNIVARITPLTWGIYYILLVLKLNVIAGVICILAIILTLTSGVIYWRHYLLLLRKAKIT